jgi:hypothetical protein
LNAWFVVVYAWKASCHTTYKVMHAKQQPGFRPIYLDDAPASIRELEVDWSPASIRELEAVD